jgi:glycosyltransferase involved in cell wall biosynthesis
MNIGLIWHSAYPWDVRLEKMAGACIEAGHSVSIVSKGTADRPATETVNGAAVFRVSSKMTYSSFAKLAAYPLFFSPIWRSRTLAALWGSEVDVVIVRDLPLAGLGLWVGRQMRKPVLLDMAENYPAALVAYQKPMYRPLLVNNAWLPRKYEQHAIQSVDHVFVVAEEQRRRLIRLGVAPARITTVGNTPVQSFIDAAAVATEDSRKMNLLYVGNLDRHRGADLLVKAFARFRNEFRYARLTLVGDGNQKEALIAMVKRFQLEDAVSIPGRVQWGKIAEFIRQSTICLIPHLRSEHTDTTLPNKLFDYMAFSKPVIASDCAPLKRIIEQERCGKVFRSGDVEDLAAALSRMAIDPSSREAGKNGRAAVEREYNWNMDKARLLTALEHVSRTATNRLTITNVYSRPAAVSA